MQPDERIVNYMKERNGFARAVACTVAVQLFALAVYFCLYAVISSDAFYSLSERTGKIIIISLAVAIAIGLCVVNVLMVIKSKRVYITRPDSIALRDAKDTVAIAYSTARPVLIYKITYSLVLLTVGGIVYIILGIYMDDAVLAGLYGRTVCCVICAAAVLIAYPCIDRIACYRALLGETHVLSYDIRPDLPLMYILSVVTPLCICLWYVLRYYMDYEKTAWILFPVTALFALAIPFLIGRAKIDRHEETT